MFQNINIGGGAQQGSQLGNNTTGTGGGLFQNKAPQQSGAGGGQAPTTGGGIFNNTQNQPLGTGQQSIFGGAQQKNTAPTNQPLFGAQSNANPTNNTALNFGVQNTATTNPAQTGGLFGNNKPVVNQQAQNTTKPNPVAIGTNPTTNLPTNNTQTNPQTQYNNPASDVSLANEKLNPLVQKWKRKIQNQSESLLQTYTQLSESITQIEQCYKYYDNIATISQGLNGQFEQINVEVNNIEQYQVQIENHLDMIRSKLTKQLELQGDSEAKAFNNPIGEKIQGIDYGLSQIEKNVNQLIDEINPQKDQSQDGKNTIQQSLNSYYQILEKLEYDTINLQFKLQSAAEKVSEQQ